MDKDALGERVRSLFDSRSRPVMLEDVKRSTSRTTSSIGAKGFWIAVASFLVVLAVVVPVALLTRSQDDPSDEPRDPAPPTTPVVTTTPVDELLDGSVRTLDLPESIPLKIVAVRPNRPSVVLVDLQARTASIHPPGRNGLTGDAVDNVAITATGDIVISAVGLGRVLNDTLDGFTAEFMLRDPQPRDPGLSDGFWVIPTLDGAAAWLFRDGHVRGEANAYAELVDLATGDLIAAVELHYSAQPAGMTTAGLVFDSYVQHGEDLEIPDSHETWVLDGTGSVSLIGPGWAEIADRTVIARRVCESGLEQCELIVEVIGRGEVAIADPPQGARWEAAGSQIMPTSSASLSTVSPDGDRLLLAAIQWDPDPTQSSWQLHVIDLEDGEATLIAEGTPFPMAAWSRDGRWVAVIDLERVILIDTHNPGRPSTVLEDLWPEDHFPFAAG